MTPKARRKELNRKPIYIGKVFNNHVENAMKKLNTTFLLTIAISLIISGLIVVTKPIRNIENINISNVPINIDAEIIGIMEKRALFFGRSTSRTIIKDGHGHLGSVYGTWGFLGDTIEVQCTNGNLRIY